VQSATPTCHSDRGIAKADLGDYFGAIFDFNDALRAKDEEDIYRPQLYQNRDDAYSKVQDWRRAVDDYTSAIHLRLKRQIAVLTVAQFRGIYPEYAGVSDGVLVDKLNRFFMPQFAPDVFKRMLKDNDGKFGVSLLNDLYESRGDAYLKLGDYARGIRDFQRIYVGIPDFANVTDRWRSLGTFANGETYYLDVKSSKVSSAGSPSIWVKNVKPKESTVMAFSIDCSGRRMRVTSSVMYDSKNNSVDGSTNGGGWNNVTPDTLGEQLWTGACKAEP
jgi:tetratricopeptide (TPR) repeat protein